MFEHTKVRILLGGATISLALLYGQDTEPVGKTELDRARNAALLSGYDYKKYTSGITGYNGMDRQRIAFLSWKPAIRTRIGPRGNYKTALTRLANGKLLAGVCRRTQADARRWETVMYESDDQGLTWSEVGNQPVPGKEASLTALPGGAVLLTTQQRLLGPRGEILRDEIRMARSEDSGRTWQIQILPSSVGNLGDDYPRNLIVEPDGSVLMIRALKPDWRQPNGSPNLELGRSRDGGRTWHFSEGIVDWDYATFGEVSAIRLRDGRLLAALRRQMPATERMEGFHDTFLTESTDDGKHWSRPRRLSGTAEVHFYLTELADGRILATYSNYHLPFGVFAIVSRDGGRTWDHDNPIQLALSADLFLGWPVTLEMKSAELVTAYALTGYLKQPPETFVCEIVKWNLP